MDGESVATIVVAGLPADVVAALRSRLPGCAVLDAADATSLVERVRAAPHVLLLGGWALGDRPDDAVRRLRAGSALLATKMVCCLRAPGDPSLPERLVAELGVGRLLFEPLETEEVLRQVGELAGVTPSASAIDSRAERLSAGLAGIWARFREPTLRRLDVIERATLALLEGALSPEQRGEAQREAHKLAGTAGTFGFPRSSELARQIEERLSLGSLVPADAVPLSEQLVALRADLEAPPRTVAAPRQEPPAVAEAGLLLVGADPALGERVESEGAARGLRVALARDPAAARELARTAPPAVVAVCIADSRDATSSLDLIASLASAEPSAPGLVLAPRDASAVRIESARRGAQRFLELPASPASIVSHALALAGRASAPPRRVLAVDDDPKVLALLRTVLGWSAREVHTVEDPLRFWSVLEDVRPELLVLDVDMPHVTGLELARAVRSDPRWAHLPIIFLTARTDADTVRRAYAAGADDHLAKPLVVEELMTRVRNRLERAPARDEAGDTDAATGVGGHGRTADLLARFLHLARRRHDPFAVATVAVNDLDAIVEAHGQAAADLAWRATAQLLARSLRGEDVVGRWSADELVVGLYDASKRDAAQRLAAVLAALARRDLTAPRGGSFSVTASGGVAQFPDDGQDVEALHDAASRARRTRAHGDRDAIAIAGRAPVGRDDGAIDIVLVDDDEALVGLMEHTFETSGHRVRVFRDGESAAAALLADVDPVCPRVILLDVDLPALNGLDLLRRLHRGGVTARSHVVMLTARAGEQDMLTALSLGAADHVTKPFSVAVLLQKLRPVLDEAG